MLLEAFRGEGAVIDLAAVTGSDSAGLALLIEWLSVAKAAGRAFEIAGYRYDAIFRPLEQLLVPKESPAAKKGSTAASDGSAGHPASKKRLSAPPP